MIQTESSWADSGYDCDHCGGQVLIRTDRETGQPDRRYYQCEVCACQWTMAGEVLRVGHLGSCKTAQRMREMAQQSAPLTAKIPPLLLGIGLLLVVALLFLLGGVLALRFLLPLALGVLVAVAVHRFGRERMWW